MDTGCKLWGVELSSLDVNPEDTGQFLGFFFRFKHAVLKQILFWRNPLTRLKTCLIIYVDAHLPVCAYYRLRSLWWEKNMFFRLCDYGGLEGQNTTFHKTQPHFRKTLRHYRKHCSINVFWVMWVRWPPRVKRHYRKHFPIYKTENKNLMISEKHNFLLTVVVVWHMFCEVFWPSGPPYLPRQHHSNISCPVFFYRSMRATWWLILVPLRDSLNQLILLTPSAVFWPWPEQEPLACPHSTLDTCWC